MCASSFLLLFAIILRTSRRRHAAQRDAIIIWRVTRIESIKEMIRERTSKAPSEKSNQARTKAHKQQATSSQLSALFVCWNNKPIAEALYLHFNGHRAAVLQGSGRWQGQGAKSVSIGRPSRAPPHQNPIAHIAQKCAIIVFMSARFRHDIVTISCVCRNDFDTISCVILIIK